MVRLAEGAASFHTTRWTIVMRAAQSQAQGGQPASFFARSPRGGEAAAFKRCLGIAPGQNWEQLLLRDGVCRGGNAGEPN
jgi:hypothetical protein